MNQSSPKILVGVSRCLLGDNVRYDGQAKQNALIQHTLGKIFEYRPICPEVEIGLGVPREPIQLVKIGTDTRSIGVVNTTFDVTDSLRQLAHSHGQKNDQLCGFIFKKNSPSCGIEGVNVVDNGHVSATGMGIYAQQFSINNPSIPIEDEDRLENPEIRARFVARVMRLHRWRQLPSHSNDSPE